MRRIQWHPGVAIAYAALATLGVLLADGKEVNHAEVTSALATAAAHMKPRTWAVLNTAGDTSGYGPALLDACDGLHNILEWTGKGAWDPASHQFLYIGQGHYSCQKFIIYRERTNKWSVEPRPFWDCTADAANWPNCIGHAYDINTIDPVHGQFYFRKWNMPTLYRYGITTKTWTALSPPPLPYAYGNLALAYFPERNGVLLVSGLNGLFWFDSARNTWTVLTGPGVLPIGSNENFATYDSAHRLVLFGGGDARSRVIYKLDTTGRITRLHDSPIPLGIYVSVIVQDPATGKYLVFGGRGDAPGVSESFWEYDVVTDRWNRLWQTGSPDPPLLFTASSNPVFNTAAAPVDNYGVTMFVSYKSDQSQVLLYKHETGQTHPADSTHSETFTFATELSASGDTVRHGPDSAATTYESDFDRRCRAPGVVKCVGFDSPSDIAGSYGQASGILAGQPSPVLDPSVKTSGASSLKFTIAPNTGAGGAGAYFTNFSNDLSVQFGGNQGFYVQWLQRFSPELLTTSFKGGGGWKQAIIGTGDQVRTLYPSCTALTVVLQNIEHRGFARLYNSCTGSASHGPYDPFVERFEGPHGFDFKLQNARPSPYCLYSQGLTTPPGYFPPTGNCVPYVANEWMTFQVGIKTGPRTNGEFRDSHVKLWIARQGQPSDLVIDWGPYNLTAGPSTENQEFGKIWLLPYNTDKDDSQAHPTAYTWYDELIISRSRIPDPRSAASSR